MRVGVQYRGQVNASATERVFTYNWPADWHVLWYVTPTNPRSGVSLARVMGPPVRQWHGTTSGSSASASG
jgi:hypothetical protein